MKTSLIYSILHVSVFSLCHFSSSVTSHPTITLPTLSIPPNESPFISVCLHLSLSSSPHTVLPWFSYFSFLPLIFILSVVSHIPILMCYNLYSSHLLFPFSSSYLSSQCPSLSSIFFCLPALVCFLSFFFTHRHYIKVDNTFTLTNIICFSVSIVCCVYSFYFSVAPKW